jgi:hypothetical protein
MTNKPPSKRVDLLKDRNSKLSAQVSVQRQEINRLQRSLDELQDKEEERQETVLCVNRLWEELNGSISFLSFRYVFSKTGCFPFSYINFSSAAAVIFF